MILPSLKKHRITRSNILRTNPSRTSGGIRPIACLLLAGVVIALSVDADAATPRRRGAPLERLKRRSASARWDELRQSWSLSSGQETSVPESDSSPTNSGKQEQDTRREISTKQEPSAFHPPFSQASESRKMTGSWMPHPEDVASGSDGMGKKPRPAENAVFDHSRVANPSEYQDRMRAVPGLPALPAGRNFVAAQATDDSFETQGTPIPPTDPTENLLPKPITSILPYYDYSPEGEDPCEYLCPTPEGCPENMAAKPCPERVSLPDVSPEVRDFVNMHVQWEPSNLFHNPLYFEDPALERYGHTHGDLVLQPAVSIGRFGVQLIGLPYQIALHPICERQFVLGWHRPGECVPYRYHLPPWNTKAAITAAAAYTGLIYLFP